MIALLLHAYTWNNDNHYDLQYVPLVDDCSKYSEIGLKESHTLSSLISLTEFCRMFLIYCPIILSVYMELENIKASLVQFSDL